MHYHGCLVTILYLTQLLPALGASLSPQARALHPREDDLTFSPAKLLKKADDEQSEAPIDKPLSLREFPQPGRRKQGLTRRADRSDNWYQSYQVGARRYHRFTQKYNSNPIPADTATINLNQYWDLEIGPDRPFSPYSSTSGLLPYINSQTDRGCRDMEAVDKREPHPRTGDDRIHFDSMYCPNIGVIIAEEMYKYSQVGEALNSWSDVTWAYWKSLCTEKGIAPSAFQWYIASAMGSDDVIELFMEILKYYSPQTVSNQAGDTQRLYTIADTDVDFIALFSCGQLNSLLWLLTDHMIGIGHKRPMTMYIFRPMEDDDEDCGDYTVDVMVHVG
ncbi:uncharacterized protein N7459_005239 [Penicillium hispanicum]|uniref:uncharacterized protein n=1 Tax=Penicillium hispanicum TaxID=1080232 RepID=UPI002541D1DE|nr:uncharacterized protein N7459_005239 [Penicillium hispanicum]KAJ5585439.1 hypothetical protein N7459_005239 [Penicillium hispanicum]